MKISKKITTKNKHDILLYETENKNFDKTILLIGVFHGDEPQGEYLINRFIDNLDETKLKNKLLFIPCLNPDGKELNTRQNANGVDLNRNFPTTNWCVTEKKDYFGGNKPNSETETQFMTEVLNEHKIDLIVSLHAPFEIVNFDGDASGIADKISKLIHYPVQKDIGYPTPGSFGTYAGVERNIKTITLELCETKTDEELWNDIKPMFDSIDELV